MRTNPPGEEREEREEGEGKKPMGEPGGLEKKRRGDMLYLKKISKKQMTCMFLSKQTTWESHGWK